MTTIEFIKQWEGYKSKAYKPLKSDVWTIGYGRTENVHPWTEVESEQEEEMYVLKRIQEIRKKYSEHYANTWYHLTNNQQTALVSFTYNTGKYMDVRHWFEAKYWLLWVHSGKHRIQGLVNRRRAELQLFSTPDKK